MQGCLLTYCAIALPIVCQGEGGGGGGDDDGGMVVVMWVGLQEGKVSSLNYPPTFT